MPCWLRLWEGITGHAIWEFTQFKKPPEQLWKFIIELNPKSRKPTPISPCLRLIHLIKNKQMWQTALIYIFPLFHTDYYIITVLSENHLHLPSNSFNFDNRVKTKMPLENGFGIPPVSYHFVHKFLSSLIDVNQSL